MAATSKQIKNTILIILSFAFFCHKINFQIIDKRNKQILRHSLEVLLSLQVRGSSASDGRTAGAALTGWRSVTFLEKSAFVPSEVLRKNPFYN